MLVFNRKVLIFLILGAALSGCVSTDYQFPEPSRSAKELILSGGISLPGDPVEIPSESTIWQITPEMDRFIRHHVPENMDETYRLRSLMRAIQQGNLLGIQYDATRTFMPKDVFDRQRANCLSYSMLVYALAKHAGVDVEFNNVDIPPVWDLVGSDRLYLYKHVNIKFKLNSGEIYYIDVNFDEFDPSYRQRRLSENDVLVNFYNNVAVELMFEGNYSGSYEAFMRAMALDAETPYVWSNLGVMLRRAGQLALAKEAFLIALDENKFEYIAASNLSRILRAEGDVAFASTVDEWLDRYRRKNPYYLLALANQFYEEKDYVAADRHIARAITIRPDDHRLHFMRAKVLAALGNKEAVLQELAAAEDRALDPQHKKKYRGKYASIAALNVIQ